MPAKTFCFSSIAPFSISFSIWQSENMKQWATAWITVIPWYNLFIFSQPLSLSLFLCLFFSFLSCSRFTFTRTSTNMLRKAHIACKRPNFHWVKTMLPSSYLLSKYSILFASECYLLYYYVRMKCRGWEREREKVFFSFLCFFLRDMLRRNEASHVCIFIL